VTVSGTGISAATTLIAVMLGGWLTVRAQERLWRRDHQRQWRDIRLEAYMKYLTAFRQYVAYVLRPDTRVAAVPRPRQSHRPMPIFDETGSPYKERLEATKTALRLIASQPRVVRACNVMIRYARQLAEERATHDIDAVPPECFQDLWSAEREFVLAAREELGLASDFEIGDRPSSHSGKLEETEMSPLAVWLPDPQ
jgi:hypothetical protein